ncbi:MAG: bifunctional folylpolyglutamate synthase/dihydrofolate synthase [Bryobacterales bacterium]|nr:bifunctional folylpolyglutamate synthase/dihydrofolate synthase [Bryobacterales bacterium]
MERLLEALGHPERRYAIIHVAGTNGKGSACAMIAAGLQAWGKRTGLYTSPHIEEPVERIAIDGVPVTASAFTWAFDRVHEAAERLLADEALDAHPTYFETVTAMGFLLFAERGVEAAAVEVGLGGRLDATNVVQPAVTAITRIDYDHEAFLGKGLARIAGEKAGILKPGVPAVFAPQRAEVTPVLEERAAAVGAPVERISDWRIADCEVGRDGSRWRVESPVAMDLECSLAGGHQVENALTAAAALRRFGVPIEAVAAGIGSARWPGRLERFARDPEILLDGAHNPSGARALAAHLERFYGNRRLTVVFAMMRDKSVEEMTGAIFPLAERVIVTAPRHERALDPASIAAAAEHPAVAIAGTVREALQEALRAPDLIVVYGSLFLVAEARKELGALL